MQPLVSVVITTKNSARTLNKLLISIKVQSYKKKEIIVVDNYSLDNTADIARKFTDKVFYMGPERSSQRNFGFKKSKGSFVLFVDSDMILTKNVISECVNLFKKNPNVGGIVIPEKSFGKGFWSKAKSLERNINEGEPYFEAARFFSRKIFLTSGGYDETITGPEDWELPERISKKYSMKRIRNYIYHDEGEHTLLGLARKKYYYGLSTHKYLKKHKMSPINAKTIYILRPVFYRKWKEAFKDPILYLGMWLMLLMETIGGGLGYFVGRFRDED